MGSYMVKKFASTILILCLIMTGFTLQPVFANSVLTDTQIKDIIDKVRPTLLATTYDSSEVAGKIAPSRFQNITKVNKQIEISKRTGRKFIDIKPEEVIAELQKDYVQSAGYKQTYEKIQKQLDLYLTQIIKSDSKISNKSAESYVTEIKAKPAELLLGMTYIQRLYDFDYNGFNFAEGLRTSGSFGKDFSPMQLAISIGSQKGDDFAMPRNIETFNKLIVNTVSNATDINSFITTKVPTKDVSDWYASQLNEHGNIVAQVDCKNIPDGTYKLYDKLNTSKGISYILPLLTRANANMFLISNPSSISWGMQEGYIQDTTDVSAKDKLRKKINIVAQNQADYIDFWARMVPEKKNNLKTTRILTDGFFVAGRGTGKVAWSPKVGDKATKAVNEFFGPMNKWYDFKFVGAEASGEDITFWISRLLENTGNAGYSHELTHQLAGSTYLKGYGIRSGTSAELLPRGLYETYDVNDPIYGLNQITNWEKDGYQNSSVKNFTDESSVNNYVRNMIDVTNTLDLLEAQEILSRDANIKQKWFNIVSLTPSAQYSGKFDEKFEQSDLSKASSWKNINDLIDANAVVSRYEAEGQKHIGIAKYNGYPVIPLFSPLFGAPVAANGSTGDVHMRRIAWELFGEYGYSKGMVPYLSDQYKPQGTPNGQAFSDSVILQKIASLDSVATLRKNSFAKREKRLNELKPVTIKWQNKNIQINSVEKLRELFKQAIDADLAITSSNIRSINTNIEQLKSAIYLAYKKLTNEFDSSIYEQKKTYTLTYETTGEKPLDTNTPIDNKTYNSGETVTLSSAPKTASMENSAGVDGKWTFNGWKLEGTDQTITQITIADKDIKVVGSWTFTPNIHKVTYQITSEKPDDTDVPIDETSYITGQKIVLKPLPKTTRTSYQGEKGTWKFTGWLLNGTPVTKDITVNKANIVLSGSWSFTPTGKHTVTFVYKTSDSALTLPAQLLPPAPQSEYKGTVITMPDSPADYVDKTNKGTWKFKNWNPAQVTLDQDITVIGTWDFVPDPINYKELEAELKRAQKVLSDTVISANGKDVEPNKKWVTRQQADVLQKKINQAMLAIKNGTFDSQQAVEIILQQVLNAKNELLQKQLPGLKQSNKSTLIQKIAKTTPKAPIATLATCKIAPEITIPSSNSVYYTVNDMQVDAGKHKFNYGQHVKVIAKPLHGYAFTDSATTDWSWNFATRESLRCDSEQSGTSTPAPTPTPPAPAPILPDPAKPAPGPNAPAIGSKQNAKITDNVVGTSKSKSFDTTGYNQQKINVAHNSANTGLANTGFESFYAIILTIITLSSIGIFCVRYKHEK